MPHELLFMNSITLAFDKKLIFENLTYKLDSGENLLVTGANGSGKTSLVKILVGELEASKGSHQVSNYVYLPASPINPGFRKVEEYFQLFGSVKKRESEFCEIVLSRIKGKSMSRLSSGEFKSAAIARIFSIDRAVYILDEPTVTLDEFVIEAFMEEMKILNNFGCSFVIATNNIGDFSKINYRELVLKKD